MAGLERALVGIARALTGGIALLGALYFVMLSLTRSLSSARVEPLPASLPIPPTWLVEVSLCGVWALAAIALAFVALVLWGRLR